MNQQTQMIVPAAIVKPEERVRNIDNYDKEYLLLLFIVDENGNESKDWLLKRGRKEAYEYLKDIIVNEGTLDPVNSKVLANGATLGDEINVGKFMRFIKDKYFIDDEFDIDDYFNPEDYSDEDLDKIEAE